MHSTATPRQEDEMHAVTINGEEFDLTEGRIPAIKAARAAFNLGLREAKDYVAALAVGQQPPIPKPMDPALKILEDEKRALESKVLRLEEHIKRLERDVRFGDAAAADLRASIEAKEVAVIKSVTSLFARMLEELTD